jgi:hypothetical protein
VWAFLTEHPDIATNDVVAAMRKLGVYASVEIVNKAKREMGLRVKRGRPAGK